MEHSFSSQSTVMNSPDAEEASVASNPNSPPEAATTTSPANSGHSMSDSAMGGSCASPDQLLNVKSHCSSLSDRDQEENFEGCGDNEDVPYDK